MPEPNQKLRTATVPEQPEASAPINKRQPLIILLFVILLVFVISSVVTASKKAAPLKSQLTARPATANPQQVNSFETQQEQVAKKDQEVQQQQAATAALLAAIQGCGYTRPRSSGRSADDTRPASRHLWPRQSERAAGNVADVGTAGGGEAGGTGAGEATPGRHQQRHGCRGLLARRSRTDQQHASPEQRPSLPRIPARSPAKPAT